MINPFGKDNSWLIDAALAALRVLLIALLGATGDAALFDGRVGGQLAAPLPELSSRSSGAPLEVSPLRLWQSE